MALEVTKDSIDLGIVTRDPERMLVFYRDTLGLAVEGEMELPGDGHMVRLLCGTSVIKLVTPAALTDVSAPPGGISGATGYRYWTISVADLHEVVARCAEAGSPIAVEPTEIRPGVTIAIVEDPDGNSVELLHKA